MLLPFLFILGFVLRTYNLGLIPFSGDSGRDFLVIHNIIQTRQLPLLGPPTSLGWLHLGPFIYYLWIPLFHIFHGDPRGIAFFSAFLDSLVAPLLFFSLRRAIGTRSSALAALFYATSPLIIIWARTPLHPSLSPFFATALVTLLASWKDTHSPLKIICAGLVSGIILQTHLAPIVLVTVSFLYLLYTSTEHRRQTSILFLGPLILTLLPLIYYDMQHKFSMLRGLLVWAPYRLADSFGIFETKHLLSPSHVYNVALDLDEALQRLLFLPSLLISTLMTPLIIIPLFKRRLRTRPIIRICLSVLFSSLVLVLLFGSVQEHYLTFLFPIISVLVGASLSEVTNNHRLRPLLLILTIVFFINIVSLVKKNFYLDSRPNINKSYGLSLKTQIQIADWITNQADNHSFTIKPRPDIVNLPNYLDNYNYLILWRWHKVPIPESRLMFTIYDVWPYPTSKFSPQDTVKVFTDSAVVLSRR